MLRERKVEAMNIDLDELLRRVPPRTAASIRKQLGVNAAAKPKRRKFGNQPVVVDGRRFDSKAEARRYEDLRRLHAAGEVLWFCLQPVFRLPGGIEYRPDFIVCRRARAEEDALGPVVVVVEDVKGGQATKTKEYRLKKRLMKDRYGIEVVEVQA